jgi:DNA-binding NarL/FixJ family response regulator
MTRPRVLLADDHSQVRDVVRKLLEPACEVIGWVDNGRALLSAAAELKPDLVLIDVGLPMLNGLAAGRELKLQMPEIKLLYFTMEFDPTLADEAFRIGASGYLLKSRMGQQLLPAILKAMSEAS